MSLEWYNIHWKKSETNSFSAWWKKFYGEAEAYGDQDEYWLRKGFSLAGWIGKDTHNNLIIKIIAPWTDYMGEPIHEGDMIKHPSGECGVVTYDASCSDPHDAWRVDYGDGNVSRLSLQVGDKGQARLVKKD